MTSNDHQGIDYQSNEMNISLVLVDNNLQCQPLEHNGEKLLLAINSPCISVANNSETFIIKRLSVSTFIFILFCNISKKQTEVVVACYNKINNRCLNKVTVTIIWSIII